MEFSEQLTKISSLAHLSGQAAAIWSTHACPQHGSVTGTWAAQHSDEYKSVTLVLRASSVPACHPDDPLEPVLSTLARWFDAASADLMRGHCREIGCRSLPTTPYHQPKPTECRDCSFEIS